MIRIPCRCGRMLVPRPELFGKTARCPKCGAAVNIPKDPVELAAFEKSAPTPAPGPAGCTRHPGQRPVGKCTVCGVTICSECRHAFGYFCSKEHKGHVDERPVGIASLEPQTTEDRTALERSERTVRLIKRTVVIVAALGILLVAGRWILDKGGRVRWEAEIGKDAPVQLLAEADGVRVVTGEGKVLTFDGDGSRTSESSLAQKPEMGGSIGIFGDRIVVAGDGKATGFAIADGRSAWTCLADVPSGWNVPIPRDGNRLFAVKQELTPEQEQALKKTKKVVVRTGPRVSSPTKEVEVPDIAPEFQLLVDAHTHLVAIDAATGKEAWKVPFDTPVHGVRLLAGNGHVMVREDAWAEGSKGLRTTVTIHSTSDGKALFRLSPDVEIVGDPLLTPQGLVVVTVSGPQCLKYADGALAWSIPVNLGAARKKKEASAPELTRTVWVCGENLILRLGTSLSVIRLSDGKLLWGIDAGASVDDVVETDGMIVCSGATSKPLSQEVAEAPTFTIGQADLSRTLSEEMAGATIEHPVAFGLDSATGRRLWSADLRGGMVRTDSGIVFFSTNGRPDLFAPLGRIAVSAEAVVQLVDSATGKILWEYRTPGSLAGLVVTGRTVVFGVSPDKGASKIVAVWLR